MLTKPPNNQRQAVRDETAHDLFMSRVGVPLGVAVAGTPFGKMKLPMRLASKMWALVNDKKAAKARHRREISKRVHHLA